MVFPDSDKTMRYISQWLLLPAFGLALILLGFNLVLLASAIQRWVIAPPPPEYIPLPITGGLTWLLWLGPLIVVVLLYLPGLIAHLGRKQDSQKTPNMLEPGTQVHSTSRQQKRRRSLRLGLLLLAFLAQLLVILNAQAFNTTGNAYLQNVVMVSRSEAWATGYYNYNIGDYRSILWHYHAGQWEQVDGPDVSGLTALPNGDVWGVNDQGWIEHESQGNWIQMKSGTTDPLNAIAMRSSTEGWAVGGYNHTPIAARPGGTLRAMGFELPAIPGTLTKSFTNCRIVHYVAGNWSPVPCPVSSILRKVTVLPDGSAWAVGDNGTILYEHAGSWVQIASPTTNTLWSVAMVSSDEGWAVGYQGTILHYTHKSWQQLSAQTTSYLWQVTMVSPDEGWIVG
ncbi:MAG TPA: hypothetical protein VFN23_11500, partial [Ktedonobacteraceae bacterium]|nr:hypothetical protein [Ktedonobacteraceae bacterium]